MQFEIIHVLFLIAGLVAGGSVAWFILKGRLALAEASGRAAGDVERARLTEQLKAAMQDSAQVRQRCSLAEQAVSDLRASLETVTTQRTQFEERAARVPELEASLRKLQADSEALSQQIAGLREATGKLSMEVAGRQEQIARLDQAATQLTSERDALNRELTTTKTLVAKLTQELEAERSQSQDKLALLEQAKQTLSDQFKALASEILDEKSKKFTEQNQTNIGQLLNPIKEKMTEFRAKVEEIHLKDAEQQAALKAELGHMKELNRQMTAEAHSLATALKGEAKKRGNWGELILGNVLDRSGLREGKDYQKEVSFNTEDGRKRPDVIVYLPQGKHLVIDAKVSLNAYTRYVNAEDDLSRQQALQQHVVAVASRIQELADRSYFELPGINSPEMVFMFIPIESAFVEALRADENLFQRAIEHNVLVATPTTLLTSLNIVRQLWRFEEQNAHTAELAERAAKVYKKLASFLGSMEDVGKQLDKAKGTFTTAMGQLYSGKDNLIKQAKEFERLGVSVQAALPEKLVATALLELEHIPDPDGIDPTAPAP